MNLIYKNTLGGYNILVTTSSDEVVLPVPIHETYNAHIWIHNNEIIKNHINGELIMNKDQQILQAYKEGFNAALESLKAANDIVQHKNI